MRSEQRDTHSPVRVLVVDDSPFMRKAIVRMLRTAGGIEVVEAVATGEAALEAVERLAPDVVTLDVVMPGIDGITVLERMMERHPVPVLMLSALTTSDAEITLSALEKGAVDVVAKPSGYTNMDMPKIASELVEKVRAAAGVDPLNLGARGLARGAHAAGASSAYTAPLEVLVVGASTGGPPALGLIANALPADFPAAVLLIQHMPVGFTGALAERLDRTCRMPVMEAADGDIFEPGRVFVARSGKHVHMVRRRNRVVLRLDLNPGGTAHIPSIDVAMDSAAAVYGERGMGVLLTGMGEDGARGLLAMRRAGAFTVAEDEHSAVVWGMPRAAATMGACESIAPLAEIPPLVLDRARRP